MSNIGARFRLAKAMRNVTILGGGARIDTKENPDMNKLNQGALSIGLQPLPDSSKSDWNSMAQDLLSILADWTISGEKRNFSLTKECGVTEAIDNENILDKQAYQSQPDSISAEDKFPNEDDPFYTLDNDIPDDYDQKNTSVDQKNQPDVTCFAAAVAEKMLNIQNTTSTTTGANADTQTTTTDTNTTTTGTNY